MQRFSVKEKGWMSGILEYYQGTVESAKQGFYQDEEQPHIRMYESPEIDNVMLVFGKFPVFNEGYCIESYHELMEYVQTLVKSEITAPDLKLWTGFTYQTGYGRNINKKPHKCLIISAEWEQK